jgi:type IV pilus assembly protein PilW
LLKKQYISISQRGKMTGLSLIELMIALTLGLILTLGVTQIFLGTSQTYRLTDSVAHAQENIRFATSIMERNVRSAGGIGCLQDPADITVHLGGNRVVDLGDGLVGWEANGTGIGDNFTATAAMGGGIAGWSEGSGGAIFPADLANTVMADTDVLIVNAFQTVNVNVLPPGAPGTLTLVDAGGAPLASGINQDRIVLTTEGTCSSGELFQKANDNGGPALTMAGVGNDPGNLPASSFDLNYVAPSRVAELTTVAYYIGAGTGGEPALFMRVLDAVEPPVELVDGVETMQILYGVDTDAIPGPNDYVTAAGVNDWAEVVSVRASLLIRSDDNVTDTAQVRIFNMLGTQVSTQADRRTRLLATKTIGLRNRLP